MNKKKNHYAITMTIQNISPYEPINLRGSYEECADIAKKYGYDALEIQMRDLALFDPVKVESICRDRGLVVCAYSFPHEISDNGFKPLITDDEKERKRSIALFKEYLNVGKALNAKLIFGAMKGRINNPSNRDICYGRLTESLKEICAEAEKRGVTLAVEVNNRYLSDWLTSAEENVQLIKDVNSSSFELLIDTHHLHITERSVDEAIESCKDQIGYVHLAESNRNYLGGGNIDFFGFMRKMLSIGYDGYYTVENMPTPNQEINAKVSINYIKGIEAALRALPEFE